MINHPNRSTLWTVIRPSGTPEAEGCTVTEAADVILSYDGGSYEIRRGDAKHDVDGEAQWELWTKRNNGRWDRASSVRPEYAATAGQAWPLIAREVLKVSGQWRNGCTVMTDTAYAAMLAEIAAEEGGE